jgi:hypothetical protein
VDLTVACVLRSGSHYLPRHVAGLHAQVRHWLPGARFVCLSDVPVPCERIALETDWPGWWAKVELFRHFTSGRTLYLDLDTVITGDPAPLVDGRFTMIRNWIYPHLFASGVMAWSGKHEHITRSFEPVADKVMREYVTTDKWGDQAFIAERAGEVHAFPPGAVQSFRFHARRGRPPAGATIVAFNGTHLPWHGPNWARAWWANTDQVAEGAAA